MKQFKKFCTWLLAALLTSGMVMTALAADSVVTYKGRKSGFEFAPGSRYIETDLFDDFKQVMPGDVKTEKITITNKGKNSDYIVVYIGALLHDGENNPISPKVLEELTEDDRRGVMSELEYMSDFLEQLTLTVWNGEQTEENIIYTGAPESMHTGFEGGKKYIGKLSYNQSLELNVQLAVNMEMGNEYAERIGEVDWVIVAEERNVPSDDEPTKAPTREPETEASKTETGKTDTIDDSRLLGEEYEEGFFLNLLPLTGDNTVIWPYVLLMIVSLIGIIVLIGNRRKEDKE